MFRTSEPPDLLGQVRSTVSRLGNHNDERGKNRSSRLASAARRLFGGSAELSALDEMRADSMAADTAHKLSLVESVRAKLERDRAAEGRRADPAAQTQYAADVAGLDTPTGTQTFRALRGAHDPNPQGPADAADNLYGDVAVKLPTLPPGQLERFQQALAALEGTRLATGPTNAEQLAQAGGHLQKQDLINQAANAPDVEAGNRIASAIHGHLRTPFRTNESGITTNVETGARDESGPLAQSSVALSKARAGAEHAQAGERAAHAGLYRAQAGKVAKEASGAEDGLPAQQFKALTGAKLSELPGEVRLQWIQNHAGGMSPQQNLAALQQTAKRDALVSEARQAYEAAYPKTMMGQRPTGAPDFLSFVDSYVNQKESGTRAPRPGPATKGGPETRGRLGGPAASSSQAARPRTQAEYDALPRGAVFIDPDDGQTYRKP